MLEDARLEHVEPLGKLADLNPTQAGADFAREGAQRVAFGLLKVADPGLLLHALFFNPRELEPDTIHHGLAVIQHALEAKAIGHRHPPVRTVRPAPRWRRRYPSSHSMAGEGTA